MITPFPVLTALPEHKNWTSDAWAPPGQSVRVPDARTPIRPSHSAARSSSRTPSSLVTHHPMLRSSACAHISGRECGDERAAPSLTVES